jgi:hypothetical protein
MAAKLWLGKVAAKPDTYPYFMRYRVRIEGHGVLAHMTKCIYYEKYILNAFKMLKKFKEKIPRVHMNILCSSAKDLWIKDINVPL